MKMAMKMATKMAMEKAMEKAMERSQRSGDERPPKKFYVRPGSWSDP